ncbi:TrbC/VirB2 family protein [Pseudomonas syringae]|jgi:type IV secretory pathway VirB2 component (pilin)|uniref:TrbC/VirB2 family protein n=1 Tax=Pseudomonas syringae TaxID=317 RepID=UPI00137231BF|nr:TrbC/VirB2 family protein [Pseudomonas syringae]NAP32492.1 conjugal transfer protein [Pseudomonas syringae]
MKQAIRNALAKSTSAARTAVTAGFVLVATSPLALAQTGGLTKAKTVMESFKTELTSIIPTIAVIALLALGIGYATKFVEKDTFVRWAIGIIIAGSAAQLTALFFT